MIEIHILTTSLYADDISDHLTTLGAAAVTWQDAGDQPIYEPLPDQLIQWDDIKISAYFEDSSSLGSITDYLIQQRDQQRLKSFEVQEIQEQDWILKNQEQFVPVQFGKRLWICPSGCEFPDPQAVNVIFNAGLAFGTGSHPTTALCLEWLDENLQGGETIIDYGCGSGILAVAALKLGASHAIGIDHDPQALEACRMNVGLNQLPASSLDVYLPDNIVTEPVDVLIANILAQPLIELAPRLAALIKLDGKLVLSGIMNEQYEDVMDAYQKWFSMYPPTSKNEWVRLEGRKISM